MLETSKDLLFITLAFCLLWLTIFFSWLMYYFISIVRDVSRLTGRVRNIVERVDSMTRTIHEKLESGAASFSLAATAVKEVIGWAMRERAAKAEAAAKTHRRKSADDAE
jgi:hypothetical protein